MCKKTNSNGTIAQLKREQNLQEEGPTHGAQEF